uniref:Uncharacterized protein n=1 Tax=Sinocyclocheilus anshuiensis TaxID=1608454 RepID=A0A671S1R2_9TELE
MRLRNGTFLTVSLFGLCGLISLSWYTAFSNSKGNVVDIYQREFLALRDRLHSKEALKEGREKTPKYQRTEDGFIRIGKFDNGIVEGEVDASFGPLEALRLSNRDSRCVFSELFIQCVSLLNTSSVIFSDCL